MRSASRGDDESCVWVWVLRDGGQSVLDPSSDGDHYREIVEKNFNLAVFENDMKWQALYSGASRMQWIRAADCRWSQHQGARATTWFGRGGSGCRRNSS